MDRQAELAKTLEAIEAQEQALVGMHSSNNLVPVLWLLVLELRAQRLGGVPLMPPSPPPVEFLGRPE